jgi:hypothetical protein
MKKITSIFISYSHKDRSFAHKLSHELRKRGYFVWLDEGEIKIGDSVHFVASIISRTSIRSSWVKEELEIVTNLRLSGKKVKILPILLHDVKLPGFLLGKKYADFRTKKKHTTGLKDILASLPPTKPIPKISIKELQRLKKELKSLQETIKLDDNFTEDQIKILKATRSKKLISDIRIENRKYPQYAVINHAFAFEVENISVTLGYLLWIMSKVKERGSHPIEFLITLEGKWPIVKRMLKAYNDMM